MMVVQYCFTSLIWYPNYLHLPFYFMNPFQYSTIYHYPFVDQHLNDPYQIYTFSLTASSFVSNFNLVGLFPILSICILLIYIFRFKREINEAKIFELSDRVDLIFEKTFYLTLFNLTYLVSCLIIYYRFGDLSDIGLFVKC